MPVTVRTRDDVSLADLQRIARTHTVLKTPHIGNMSPNNLLAAQCGFPIVFVDTTTPARDRNANPGLCIKDGFGRELIHPDAEHLLSTHVKVSSPGLAPLGFRQDAWIGDGHLAQAQRVFSGARIETGMTYYLRHLDRVLAMARAATDAHPGVWYRRIDANGTITADTKNGCPLSAHNNIAGWNDVRDALFLAPRTEGWVIPNLLATAIDAVLQSSEDGSVIWFLSGPDMIKYLPKQAGALSALYDAVRHAGGGTHEHVEIQLVPFTHFRFAVRQSQAESLERLLHSVAAYPHKYHRLADNAIACGDLWYRTAKRDHLSQHDLNPGESLYVPEQLAALPLREVNTQWDTIRTTYLPKEYR